MPDIKPVYFLAVDDLEENLLSVEGLLRRQGLMVLKAKSGQEALEILLEYEVALALLDVQMPGMDGFELAELMRGTERTRSVPIIFLTAGAADYQRRFRGYEAGAVDFLQKPIEADILKSKADVFFDLYRQRQEVAARRDELQAVAEENKRLLLESQRYSQALKEADQRKDEFLATLAHELRNPLAPIRNGLSLLKKAGATPHAEEIKMMMERQLVHLVRLIDDLLDVSRVSQGKIELKMQTITFQSALQAALEASRPLIEANKHTLNVAVPEEPIFISADLTRLAQILSNVLNNAAKYTPAGGKIELNVVTKENDLIISIKDNGMGIPQHMQPKIFDLFTQVENSLERSQGGLGIGLALVQRLVTMHGGTISVESAGAGKGSTFTLRLPTVPAPDTSETEKKSKMPGETVSAQRVLVVDDNVDSAKTTGWMLEMLGHTYRLAHDGEEALIAAREYRPAIVLLDIGLPKMNGYDVCRTLRKDPLFENTIFIAQTGWAQKKDRTDAQEAGFNYHLVKPVDFQKFSELIEGITDNRATLPA